MNVIKSLPQKHDIGDALDVLDKLRKDLESGKIVAFAAVGIAPDDETFAYVSATKSVSRLRMIGATAHLHACYQAGID